MDAPAGSELFQSYEQDYTTLADSLQAKIQHHIPSQTGEQKKTTVRAAERELEEADEIVAQMEMEVLNLPQSARNRLQSRLRSYKSDLDKLKRDLKRTISSAPSMDPREELFAGVGNDTSFDAAVSDQRSRLLSGTDRLANSSRRLQESHRIALETESIGANVLGTLRQQREQIINTRDTLGDADSYIDKAQRTLKGMARRMATNRLITAAIIIVLVALICLVIYRKFF
ncbi:uncharacterized protein VTP21DRAFT_2096 [Calcarisporiella thermophila]|uniref:uncharacterized protein n=1 Tax=Calcarisporiella thermophila TaxID=911321 RepID=UPI0037428471